MLPIALRGLRPAGLEAMRRGTPVVTSRVSSLPEVGGDAALYVNPYDEREIAEGIGEVFADQDLRESRSAKGRERAAHFLANAADLQCVCAYRSAAGGAR